MVHMSVQRNERDMWKLYGRVKKRTIVVEKMSARMWDALQHGTVAGKRLAHERKVGRDVYVHPVRRRRNRKKDEWTSITCLCKRNCIAQCTAEV